MKVKLLKILAILLFGLIFADLATGYSERLAPSATAEAIESEN